MAFGTGFDLLGQFAGGAVNQAANSPGIESQYLQGQFNPNTSNSYLGGSPITTFNDPFNEYTPEEEAMLLKEVNAYWSQPYENYVDVANEQAGGAWNGDLARQRAQQLRERDPLSADARLQSAYDSDRKRQLEYIQMLQTQAQSGDTQNQRLLQQQTLNAQGAVGSAAAGLRGVGGGAAMRMGAAQANQVARSGQANSLVLREQERRAAQDAIMQQYQNLQSLDSNYANMLGRQQTAGYAEQDAAAQQAMMTGAGASQAALARAQDRDRWTLGYDLDQRRQASSDIQSAINTGVQTLGTIASSAAGLFGDDDAADKKKNSRGGLSNYGY